MCNAIESVVGLPEREVLEAYDKTFAALRILLIFLGALGYELTAPVQPRCK